MRAQPWAPRWLPFTGSRFAAAPPRPRVRSITTRAVEEPKETTADDPAGFEVVPGSRRTSRRGPPRMWIERKSPATGARADLAPAPGTPKFRVDLGKGTVEIVDEEEAEEVRAHARDGRRGRRGKAGIDADTDRALVPEKQIKLRDNGNVVIAAMTEEDCVDATKLIMALFFKVRPQDFLAKDRLQKEQSERVYQGLVDGVVNGKDRLLVAAKVGGKVVGVAEVSLPGGKRFGAEKLEPRAPEDEPYISDVAVAPNQGKRGIGRQLVRACEAAMCAKGLRKMYTHTKVDNEAAQALFERAGHVEPAEIKASLTQMQIAQRGPRGAARQAGAGGGWPHPAGQGTRPASTDGTRACVGTFRLSVSTLCLFSFARVCLNANLFTRVQNNPAERNPPRYTPAVRLEPLTRLRPRCIWSCSAPRPRTISTRFARSVAPSGRSR